MGDQKCRNNVERVILKWFSDFNQDLTHANEEIKVDFLSVFSANIEWIDHAFHIKRVGHEAVEGLQKAFIHCNQPFKSDIKAIHHTDSGAVVEAIWIGRCSNDIVRPTGEIAVKAHGKTFRTHVCFVVDVDKEKSVITRINEYYHKVWEDGVGEEQYFEVRGQSMKN